MQHAKLLLIFLIGLAAGALVSSYFQQQAQCLNGSIEPVFSPGVEDEVLAFIGSAKSSLDVQLYLFSYAKLADALVAAKEKGVSVRVLLEPRLSSPNPNLKTASYLRASGIEVRWASLALERMHAKLAIADNERVLLGSPNWSKAAMLKNRETAAIISDKRTALAFAEKFEEDWNAASINA